MSDHNSRSSLPSSNIRAYVFDADGVLIPRFGFDNYLQRAYPEIAAQRSAFFREAFPPCIVGQADLREVLPPYLERWGWPHTLDDFLARWFECEGEIDNELAAVIQRLRAGGAPCYLATNQERHRAAYMREQMGLGALFDDIFASAHLGACKPEPAFYAAVTQAIGVAPEQILFWDDAPANVEGARAYGWQAQLYRDVDQVAAYAI
jgi:putative hydrolase of the HAD superfamily